VLFGYARVSTADQNPDHQVDALLHAGVAAKDIYVDHASGAKASRPELDTVLRMLRDGDTLKITRLDRLGRSVLHLVTLGAELRDRGVGLHVTEQGIDTTTAEGRAMFGMLSVLAELQRQGLVRHIGLSNVTPQQIAEGRRICEIVCVQNYYNLAHRDDDSLIDDLAHDGIAYVPFFPLGGFTPLQSSTLSDVAQRLGITPMQAALAWLLRRAPNILLIPGTSSVAHLKENLAVSELLLPDDAAVTLDAIGREHVQ